MKILVPASELQSEEINNMLDSKNSIKRVIKVDSIEYIDFENIGCHWTSNMSYIHNGGGMNGFSKGNFQVTFLAKKNVKTVNKEATEYSKEHYPHEKEVVLSENTNIDRFFILVVPFVNGKLDYSKQQRFISSGNTGNRVDSWVNNLK